MKQNSPIFLNIPTENISTNKIGSNMSMCPVSVENLFKIRPIEHAVFMGIRDYITDTHQLD